MTRPSKRDSVWWERALDGIIHSELLLVKLPLLFFSWRLPRRADWADERDDADRSSGKLFTSTAAT